MKTSGWVVGSEAAHWQCPLLSVMRSWVRISLYHDGRSQKSSLRDTDKIYFVLHASHIFVWLPAPHKTTYTMRPIFPQSNPLNWLCRYRDAFSEKALFPVSTKSHKPFSQLYRGKWPNEQWLQLIGLLLFLPRACLMCIGSEHRPEVGVVYVQILLQGSGDRVV